MGDAYEQHADAVADAVVQGKSSEALLDGYAGTARPQPDAPRRGGEELQKTLGAGGGSSKREGEKGVSLFYPPQAAPVQATPGTEAPVQCKFTVDDQTYEKKSDNKIKALIKKIAGTDRGKVLGRGWKTGLGGWATKGDRKFGTLNDLITALETQYPAKTSSGGLSERHGGPTRKVKNDMELRGDEFMEAEAKSAIDTWEDEGRTNNPGNVPIDACHRQADKAIRKNFTSLIKRIKENTSSTQTDRTAETAVNNFQEGVDNYISSIWDSNHQEGSDNELVEKAKTALCNAFSEKRELTDQETQSIDLAVTCIANKSFKNIRPGHGPTNRSISDKPDQTFMKSPGQTTLVQTPTTREQRRAVEGATSSGIFTPRYQNDYRNNLKSSLVPSGRIPKVRMSLFPQPDKIVPLESEDELSASEKQDQSSASEKQDEISTGIEDPSQPGKFESIEDALPDLEDEFWASDNLDQSSASDNQDETSTGIEVLGLTPHLFKLLKGADFLTIDALDKAKDEQLLNIRGIAGSKLKIIRNALKNHGKQSD